MKVVVIGYVCLAEARASNSKLASLPIADRRSDQLPCRMHPATGNNTYPELSQHSPTAILSNVSAQSPKNHLLSIVAPFGPCRLA